MVLHQQHLDNVVEGVVRPLTTRTKNACDEDTDFVVCYLITNTLKFYNQTMQHIVSNNGALIQCMTQYVLAVKGDTVNILHFF